MKDGGIKRTVVVKRIDVKKGSMTEARQQRHEDIPDALRSTLRVKRGRVNVNFRFGARLTCLIALDCTTHNDLEIHGIVILYMAYPACLLHAVVADEYALSLAGVKHLGCSQRGCVTSSDPTPKRQRANDNATSIWPRALIAINYLIDGIADMLNLGSDYAPAVNDGARQNAKELVCSSMTGCISQANCLNV